ncbi:MAG: hypothetical protein MJK08_06165 [Campylobacterales bacterium]|nr:hypothetical protein [Campylobacterales bacterium]
MNQFEITNDIKNLELKNISKELFCYSYDNRNIKTLIRNNVDVESEAYISAYSSFKGEVYENIIYEHLVQYALNNEDITRFVLKGPHQNADHRFKKNGLLINKSAQIVYKSVYKDISEFDALFFTKDSLVFVEMSTSKKTVSLVKRLDKKYALLKILFPSMKITALIVLTEGSIGIKKFPSYCTVWITKELDNEILLKNIIFKKDKYKKITPPKHKKFIETQNINYKQFVYFQTLEWILKNSRFDDSSNINLNFFRSKVLSLYFDIFTKLYIGTIKVEDFKTILPSFELKAKDDRVIVTIEKINTKVYDIVYYVKEKNNKLKRIYIKASGDVTMKDKEADGFTNTEVKYLTKYIFNDSHLLSVTNIKNIQNIENNISFVKIKK